MLSVTNLAGQSEPITKYSGYERHEEVNGSLELSFASFFHADNPGHDLIEEESIIEKDGYEFRVKQMSANRLSKQVIALSTFFDLNHVLREDIFAGTKTFDEFATWLFAGTGWTYENVDVVGSDLIPNFGDGNVIALNKILTTVFECEYQILPSKVIRFATQIGGDNDAQYRYGNNIKALSKKVDTTKLRTRIKGIGANGLTVTYTSPNSSTFGERDAGTITDDRYTVVDSLTEHIKRQLIDYPEVSIELDAIELQQKEVGERVWLIYEPLNIEFQTRVLAKTSRIPEVKSSVIIGNAVPQSLSDILTSTKIDVDVNKKQSQSSFEQTNEKFELEVTRIDGDVNGIDTRVSSAELKITDDAIVSAVRTSTAYAGDLNSKADTTTVGSLDTRVSSAESSITQNAGNIASKVSDTDYNGNTIASLINQTATTIDIEASKINLVGAVTVLSDITGDLGTVTAGDITGVSLTSKSGDDKIKIEGTLLESFEGTYRAVALGGRTLMFYNALTGNDPIGALAATRKVSDPSIIGFSLTGSADFLTTGHSDGTVFTELDFVNRTGKGVNTFHFFRDVFTNARKVNNSYPVSANYTCELLRGSRVYSTSGAWVVVDLTYVIFNTVMGCIVSNRDGLAVKYRNLTPSSVEVCMSGTASGYVDLLVFGSYH